MDVAASRGLATTLEMWPSGFDEVISLVSEAEVLSDVPVLVTPALDSIGSDGAVMAAAIRKAADELESFTLGLDSSFDIAQAVADVRSFRGTDNDPELDKRLRRLRELVETYTSSDVETARVMSQLLAGDDVRFRDISDVEAAMAELERFNHLEATGAISSNDPLIDDALRDLRTALADHADTDEQANQLLYALVDRGDNPASTRAVMASVLTGWSSDVVHVAHANNLDYDIADGLIKLDRVDQLTASMAGASISTIERLAIERREVLVGLLGNSDPQVLAVLNEQLSHGVAAIDAFAGLDGLVAERAEVAHRAQVEAVAEALDLEYAEAETRLVELAEATVELTASGLQAEDAAVMVQAAAVLGVDLEVIVDAASDPNISTEQAIEKAVFADAYGMTVAEYDAYRSLGEHFDVFDSARGGDADGVVSVWDLAHVVENPDKFSAEQVAAALSVLASPALRNRLDSARHQGDVVGHESFGADHAQDHKISKADMDAFDLKQQINFILRGHVDAIDVASQDGDLSAVDGNLRKHDFEAYLASPAGAELDDQTRQMIQTVIDYDWYDQDFWQRHGDAVMYAAGVIAGVVAITAGASVVLASGGTLGPVILTAMAVGAGAGTGATLTLAENALTGDPLGEDLLSNAGMGAAGALTAASFSLGGTTNTVAGRIANTVGTGADLAGIVASGAADPFLEPFVDDLALRELRDDAQLMNYVVGGASVVLHTTSAVGTSFVAGLDEIDNALPSAVNSAADAPTSAGSNALGELAQRAVKDMELENAQRTASLGLDWLAASASSTEESAALGAVADQAVDELVLESTQAAVSLDLDQVAAAASD